MRTGLFCVLAHLLLGPIATAEEPKPVELSIQPMAVEVPVLKYRLLPLQSELKPGNAAPILLRLPMEQTQWMTKVYPSLHDWIDRPLDDPKWKEWDNDGTQGLPGRFYDELKRAAFRRDADWQYPLYETDTPYSILLPDVQVLRTFLGSGLASKARYHMSKGELPQAREALMVGLANTRHLARTPFFICQLAASGLDQVLLNQTAELLAQPNSPNLYWALTNLPENLVDIESAASFEAAIFEMTLPAVHDLDRPREHEEWQRMASQLLDLLEDSMEIPRRERLKPNAAGFEKMFQQIQALWAKNNITFLKTAREELPGLMHVAPEKIATMCDEEVGIRWYVINRLAHDQATAVVMKMSPREAWPRLADLQRDLQSMYEKTGANKQQFLSPTGVYLAAAALKRKVAALRVIEAVRDHLATHDGKLPASLDEIKTLSIPVDPLTGTPFEWSVTGKTAILKAPSLAAALKTVSLPATLVDPEAGMGRNLYVEYRLVVK